MKNIITIICLFIIHTCVFGQKDSKDLLIGQWKDVGWYHKEDNSPLTSVNDKINKYGDFFIWFYSDGSFKQDYISKRKKDKKNKLEGIWKFFKDKNTLLTYKFLSNKEIKKYVSYQWKYIKRGVNFYSSGVEYKILKLTEKELWLYEVYHKTIMKYERMTNHTSILR